MQTASYLAPTNCIILKVVHEYRACFTADLYLNLFLKCIHVLCPPLI
uniref:Uncharacterized protein n=1 Tax=Anguilla anguilla TaxID=7936 RepID=A0A0E9SUG8_ANGAN